MDSKQCEEIELVTRFLCEIGRVDPQLDAGDMPDVIALLDGKRVGIESTQFHADENPGVKGSALRSQEVKSVKNSGELPYTSPIIPNPLDSLVFRITEKIATATRYDESRYDELWLLISSQIPKIGAVVSTFVFEPFVDIAALNEATHQKLSDSRFSAVHFHLMMTRGVFSWSRSKKWHIAKRSEM